MSLLCANCGKKAQLKIQQMAFMLIAVTLFFVLIGMFVLVMKFSGLKEEASMLEEENAMLLATKIANSPEFSCGNVFGTTKIACVDTDKIIVLRENMAKYSDFWGVSNIEVRKIYPKSDEIVCNLGNYPNCNVIRLHSQEIKGTPMSNFVLLCRKDVYEGESYDKCELGKIIISYEGKW